MLHERFVRRFAVATKAARMAKKRIKLPSTSDQHIGIRLRLRRVVVGMTQTDVATALGVTFQQVQKYEAGTNRIAASRIHRLAELLRVRPEFFFEDTAFYDSHDSSSDPVLEFLATANGVALMKAFQRLSNVDLRRVVVKLVEDLAERSESGT
jgi:transcriptional regulator with XRE-family HTH domain